MATATLQQKQASSSWACPKVRLGEIVLWYPGGSGDNTPFPALVVRAGQFSHSLTVFEEDQQFPKPYSGVRHVDDPNRNFEESEMEGAWITQAEYAAKTDAEAKKDK